MSEWLDGWWIPWMESGSLCFWAIGKRLLFATRSKFIVFMQFLKVKAREKPLPWENMKEGEPELSIVW